MVIVIRQVMKHAIKNLLINRSRMPDRKYLSKWLEDIMTIEGLENEGELETAQEIRNKKVLLVLTGNEPDAKSIKYALNLCKRVKDGLDILCITPDAGYGALLEEHLKKLKAKGTEYHITEMTKSIHDEVIHYTEKSHGVEFVVIDSRDIDEGNSLEERFVIEEWKGLKCPLVLVSRLAKT